MPVAAASMPVAAALMPVDVASNVGAVAVAVGSKRLNNHRTIKSAGVKRQTGDSGSCGIMRQAFVLSITCLAMSDLLKIRAACKALDEGAKSKISLEATVCHALALCSLPQSGLHIAPMYYKSILFNRCPKSHAGPALEDITVCFTSRFVDEYGGNLVFSRAQKLESSAELVIFKSANWTRIDLGLDEEACRS